MNIGIIGAGQLGSCLAGKLTKLGHQVSIANSRGPASMQELAATTGARAVTVEEAISGQQVIIVAIHEKFIQDLPGHLFAALPKDVVVIDTGNYYPNLRGGAIPELDEKGIDSQWVQEQLGHPVVKVFNSVFATSLQDGSKPKGNNNRIALPISGDDPAAKAIVSKLVDDLGFAPFGIGTIAQSWRQQPGSPIYCRDLTLPVLKARLVAMNNDWSVMQPVIVGKRKADEIVMLADYPAYLRSLQD